jgi:hypothetical protein
MVDLLDYFLDLLKLFLAVASNPMKSPTTENRLGQEKKMNSEPATLILLAGRERELKQNLQWMVLYKIFYS